MNTQLVSVRLVVITPALPDHELWRMGATMSSIPVDFLAYAPGSAAVALSKDGADVCVLDAELHESEVAAVIVAASGMTPPPLVYLISKEEIGARDGVDGVLKKPANPDQARRLVELCTRTKYPSRVLIVDDSDTMRKIVRKILSASRYRLDIHEVSEGNSALRLLRSGRFDLVFLDYNMPGLNGFDTLQEIRRKTPQVAVVMISSQTDDALVARARIAGALAFLRKPFYPRDIDQVLERYYEMTRPIG
jgi:CheY-like chemotaxis protein